MKVTLKRADFYAKSALKAATEAKYDTTLRLSIYATILNADIATVSIDEEYRKARAKMFDQHNQAIDLNTVNYVIRAQLAIANITHGVSPKLNEKAKLTAEEGRIRALLKAIDEAGHVERTADAVIAKAKAIRDQPTDRFSGGRDSEVSMAAFTDDDVAILRRQLKRITDERATINDALTSLNVSNHITLDAATVSTLRKADILPAE